MNKMNLFFRLSKIDEENRLVYGIATAELPDKSGEICDYATSVPYYKKWSGEIEKASGGKSKGNLRSMHTSIAAGKLTQITFNDAQKQIEICAKVVDDAEWNKCVEGVYTGFSQGGSYVKTWKDGQFTRYTADPAEVSLVDNPCLGEATFELKRANGSIEMVKLKSQPKEEPLEIAVPEQVWKAIDGSTHATKAAALKKNAELAAAASPVTLALAALEKEVDKLDGDGKPKDGEEEDNDHANDDEAKAAQKAAVKEGMAKLSDMLKSSTWDAQSALDALCIIECVLSCESWEAMMGEDEPGQIADLKEAALRLKSFIASEITETEDEDDDVLAAADAVRGLVKGTEHEADILAHIELLSKAGSRHSKADAEHLGKMQDHMKKMGKSMSAMQECMKGLGFDTDAAGKFAGGEGEETLNKAVQAHADEKARADALEKQLADVIPKLTELTARVAKIDNAPAAAKGKLFVVEKGHELQPGAAADEAKNAKPTNKPSYGERLTPAQQAAAILKD